MGREQPDSFYAAVYRLVRDIPRGRVMTYGQIATILGAPRAARAVGYALRASGKRSGIPWQRVINFKGAISGRGDLERPHLQRALLEREGVKFNAEDRCNLKVYQWDPPDPNAYIFLDLEDTDLPFR